jgi:23S rRNA pseudouridine2605 synthase
MRVQRALARAGAVSRREADRAVAEGRVSVNGVPADIGQLVDPARDVIMLDGQPVQTRVTAHRWIVLHKPAAVMTTRKDPGGRKTVFDLIDDVPGLVYVGRLDFMTEGVLLLTTDGTAAHALTHPSREVERTYVATVQGDAVNAAKQARRGVELEDGMVVPREVIAHPLGGRRWAFEITITEGRTHEVRRICDALGLEVERLVRTRFGPVRLGNLPSGEARALNGTERGDRRGVDVRPREHSSVSWVRMSAPRTTLLSLHGSRHPRAQPNCPEPR